MSYELGYTKFKPTSIRVVQDGIWYLYIYIIGAETYIVKFETKLIPRLKSQNSEKETRWKSDARLLEKC